MLSTVWFLTLSVRWRGDRCCNGPPSPLPPSLAPSCALSLYSGKEADMVVMIVKNTSCTCVNTTEHITYTWHLNKVISQYRLMRKDQAVGCWLCHMGQIVNHQLNSATGAKLTFTCGMLSIIQGEHVKTRAYCIAALCDCWLDRESLSLSVSTDLSYSWLFLSNPPSYSTYT